MNIGGDLMRRFGPRRLPPDRGHAPATAGSWLAATLLALGGSAVLLALAYAGFRSESAARFALVVSLTVIGSAILVAVVRWIAAPISENASIGVPDASSFLDRAWGVRRMSLDGHPVRIAVVLLALISADCAFEVSAHWKWVHSGRRTPALLRYFLAPSRAPAQARILPAWPPERRTRTEPPSSSATST